MSLHVLKALLPSLPLQATADVMVASVTLDSRQVVPGALFVARQGYRQDGVQFVDDAVRRGATVVVRAGDLFDERLEQGVAYLTVPDLDAALLEIAEHFYGVSSRELSIVAVTGTNGKTSITAFIAQMLNASGMPCGVIGTLGATFGTLTLETGHTTPDVFAFHAALLALRHAGARVVALEMSSHALDQVRLGYIRVHTAVFSNLSRDHLDYHGTLDNYFAAKTKLFHHYGASHAVIAADDEAGRALLAGLPGNVQAISVAEREADWTFGEVNYLPQGVRALVAGAGQRARLEAPLYGAFNVQNVTLAAAAAATLVADFDLARAFAALRAIPGRMEPAMAETGAGNPRVLIDFAHTPDGVEKALEASRAHFSGTLWCVLGCGGNRDAGKRPLMASVAEHFSDRLIITSDNPRYENPADIAAQMLAGVKKPDAVVVELDRARAIEKSVQSAAAEDVVLVAGKGHEQYQEVAGVKYPFSDVSVAREALRHRAGGAA